MKYVAFMIITALPFLDRCLMTAAAAKSLQLCSTLWDPIDSSTPGSPVPGILQARTLEWVASSFSSAWKWKSKGKLFSRIRISDSMDCSLPGPFRPWSFPGKSTGVGCHCPLQVSGLQSSDTYSVNFREQKRELAVDRKLALGICCLATVFSRVGSLYTLTYRVP